MIVVASNWSGPDKELDRLRLLPGPKGKAILDGALQVAYTEIKESIHVLTGALKESTTAHSALVEEEGRWEGEVVVGEGLGYAKFEQERKGVKTETGTLHDFIEINAHLIDQQYLDAVMEILKK